MHTMHKNDFVFHLVRAKSAKMTNRSYPNLALPTLASVLRDKCKVEIHDLGRDNSSNYAKYVRDTKPRVIGFTSFIDDFDEVLSLASECKRASGNSVIVVGGPHVSLLGEAINKLTKSVDFAVVGDGESAIGDLLKMLADYDGRPKIDKTFIIRPKYLYSLQSALWPAWDLYDRTPFFSVLPIETSRGCTYACKYCGEGQMYGKKVRAKSVEQVVMELKRNVEELGIRFFRFTDSTLNFSKKRFFDLCRAFVDSGLDIQWSAYARFENIDANAVALAKEAGCVALFFGVESGSESILKAMRTNLTNFDHMQRVVATAKDTGVHTHCNFIVGFPDESAHTVSETIQFIRNLNPDSVHISTFFVVPETDVHINAEKYGIRFLDPNWIPNLHRFFGDPTYSYFRHRTMTQEDIRKYYFVMRNEVEKINTIYWNLKDHLLLTWLSAGGNVGGLKKIWREPDKYLNKHELEHFEAFKEKDIHKVDDEQNGNAVIRDLAIKFR